MTSLRRLVIGLMVISLLAVLGAAVAGAAEDGPSLRDPSEFPTSDEGEDGAAAFDGTIVNRSFGRGAGGVHGANAVSGKTAKSNPELNLSFEGLNLFQNRYADNQNQFTVEPPDQALCVGNGYVFEAVNDVVNVYDTSGHSVLPPDTNAAPVPHVNGSVSLNRFFGYPSAIDRTTGVRGPTLTDPICYFDQPTQRWFLVVLTLDTFPNGQTMGPNHFDIAVSNGPSPVPLSNWSILKVPVQNDGTDGTPNHHCNPADGPRPGNQPTNPTACIADYPHLGADANGIYITSNEYDFYGDEFQSANIYAFSKKGLESGDTSHVLLETKNTVHGQPGFTVWPALSPPGQFQLDGGGTEYFPELERRRRGHLPHRLHRTADVGRAGRVGALEYRIARHGKPKRPVDEQGAQDRPVRRAGTFEPEGWIDSARRLPRTTAHCPRRSGRVAGRSSSIHRLRHSRWKARWIRRTRACSRSGTGTGSSGERSTRR